MGSRASAGKPGCLPALEMRWQWVEADAGAAAALGNEISRACWRCTDCISVASGMTNPGCGTKGCSASSIYIASFNQHAGGRETVVVLPLKKGAPRMTSSTTKKMLARVSAETGERIRASASSIEQTDQHVKASQNALDHSRQTLASTVQRRT